MSGEPKWPKPPVLTTLSLKNFLSFGPDGKGITFGPLNVLIGPNGSGKSNLLEAIALLHNAPKDLAAFIREGGGVGEWLWKGSDEDGKATVNTTFKPYEDEPNIEHTYDLIFGHEGAKLKILGERVSEKSASDQPLRDLTRAENGQVVENEYDFCTDESNGGTLTETIKRTSRDETALKPEKSMLSQWMVPKRKFLLSAVRELFEAFRLYRNWEFGPGSASRKRQPSDLEDDFLREDFRNLGLILHKLQKSPPTKKQMLEQLQQLYDGIEDVQVQDIANEVLIYLGEGGREIPSYRLSDGTLRWIALLTILLHPTPPPLVCLEEPEIGLHPDMIHILANLLKEASERMQLIVTTHSDALVDDLTDTPESVIVCEKEEGATKLKRLNRDDLKEWLAMYTLGELWSTGEIGGNRW